MIRLNPFLVLSFFLGGLFTTFIGAYFLSPQEAWQVSLLTHQLDQAINGSDPSLIYRLNTPFGLIVPTPFSTGGAYLLSLLATLTGSTQTALTLLPILGLFTLGAVFSLLSALALRRETKAHGPFGLTIACLAGPIATATGLFLSLTTTPIAGLTFIGSALLLAPLALMLHPKGLIIPSLLCWLVGLWILPTHWPLFLATSLAAIALTPRLPQRQTLIVGLMVLGLAQALMQSLELTGSTSAFDPNALSLFHASQSWLLGLILFVIGLKPIAPHAWKVAPLSLFLILTPLTMPLPTLTGLVGLGIVGLACLLWLRHARNTRGWKGKDNALILGATATLIALPLASIGPITPLSATAGWLIIAASTYGVMRLIAWQGLDIASGWAALGTSISAPLSALAGALLGVMLAQDTSQPISLTRADTFPQCQETVLSDLRVLENQYPMQRLLVAPETAGLFLTRDTYTLIGLGPLEGSADAYTALEDTSEGYTAAQRIVLRRSIDTIVVCGSANLENSLHDMLWNATTIPQWLTLVEKTSSHAVYSVNLLGLKSEASHQT